MVRVTGREIGRDGDRRWRKGDVDEVRSREGRGVAMGVMRSKGNDGGFQLKEKERESKEINSCREEEEFVGKKMIPLLTYTRKEEKKWPNKI